MNQEINLQTPAFAMTYFADKKNVVDSLLKANEKIALMLGSFSMGLYSKTIEKMLVIGLAFSSEEYPEKERLIFRKNSNKIEIRINLDYESLLQADEAQTLRLIAQTYLAAISRFLGKRKDFDSARFYADAEKLFRDSGYLG